MVAKKVDFCSDKSEIYIIQKTEYAWLSWSMNNGNVKVRKNSVHFIDLTV